VRVAALMLGEGQVRGFLEIHFHDWDMSVRTNSYMIWLFRPFDGRLSLLRSNSPRVCLLVKMNQHVYVYVRNGAVAAQIEGR